MDLLIPLALAALLIFFLFNSRRKQKARMEQIKTNLVPGASVMTTFGVFGTVVAIDEEANQVTIESGPGTTLKVHRQAIGQIDSPEAAVPAADAAPSSDAPAEAPAITDAELDAMIERKRAESADTENGASAVDPKAEHAGTEDQASADAAETDKTDDERPVKDTDADAEGTDAEGTDAEEPGSDKPGTDDGKKN